MKIDFETIVIFVSFITSFFAVFLSNGIIIGVPAIAQEFVMNNVIQNWIPTIFFLVVAVFTVPAGQISGKFGVKKSLLAGIIVYGKSIGLYSNWSIPCNIPFTGNMWIFGLQSRLEINVLLCNSISGIVHNFDDGKNPSGVENL